MHGRSTLLLSALLLSAAAAGCVAGGGGRATDDVERVPAGRTTVLQRTYMTMDTRCRPVRRPTGRLTQPPAQGSVRLIARKAAAVYGPGPYRHCDGKVGPALAFEYTPRPGYRGPDAFELRVRYADGELRDGRFDIVVY